MSLNKKLIPDLLLVGINQVIDRTTAATTFVLQGVRAIFDPSNPQNTELYYRDDAGGEHYFPSSEKLADPSAGDDIGVNAAGVTASKLNPALAELKSTSGDPSLGAQNDFNVADGSGGWIPLSTANGPRFYKDPVTNEVAYEFHIRASYFNATLGIDLKKDNGQFRFKNNAGTTTHALITTAVDSLGPGLHELLIMLCEQVNINAKVLIGQDLRVSGDLFLSGLIDSGTNTNKEMMVWDNTTATVERRPIPASGSPSQGAQYVINISDGAGGWQALDGTSLPLFEFDNTTGYLKYTGGSGFLTNVLEATDHIDISNDAPGLYFRNAAKGYMVDISVQKDLFGAGLHQVDLGGAHRFDIACELQLVSQDPGTNTGKVMLVMDTSTNLVQQRPIPVGGGSPSQGISGVLNISDGSGGWLAMDGSARPSLIWDSATGDLSFTGGNFFISDVVKSKNNIDVVNDAGSIRFRDSTDSSTLGRFYIVKDSLAPGQHEIVLADATRITIPFKLNAVDEIYMPNIFDPGTNVGKHIVITDDATGKAQKRPFSSIGGLPSDFIICTTAAEVRAALALAQDYKTIFLQTLAAATVTPSATNTPIDVYGQNVILGSTSAITFSTITPVETLQFQRTSAAYTSIRPLGMLTSLLPGSIPPNNVVELDNVKIISEMLSVPPWGFTVNGAGLGELTWTETLDANIPTQGTVTARQNFQYDWGMINTFTVRDETELLKYLQIDIPVKNLYVITDTISLSSNTISDVKGRINIYGTNLSISIASAGTLSIESASTPIKEISFFVSRLNLINVTTLNLENVSFRARTLVNSPPGTTNVTSTSTGNGTLSYENPDLTGTVTFTGAATQTFWDNTLIDAFGRLPAVDGSQLINLPSGSSSQGAQFDLNMADGSGGWTALDGTAFPQLNFDPLTFKLFWQSIFDAQAVIAVNATVTQDFYMAGLTDPGTDAGKSNVVIDGITGKAQVRPILGVVSSTNPATLTPDASTTKQINANAQAQALTVNVPTNPTDGAKVIYRIRATSTSTVTWSASFIDLKGTLPTSAPINKTILVGVMYNDFISAWEVVSVVEQT